RRATMSSPASASDSSPRASRRSRDCSRPARAASSSASRSRRARYSGIAESPSSNRRSCPSASSACSCTSPAASSSSSSSTCGRLQVRLAASLSSPLMVTLPDDTRPSAVSTGASAPPSPRQPAPSSATSMAMASKGMRKRRSLEAGSNRDGRARRRDRQSAAAGLGHDLDLLTCRPMSETKPTWVTDPTVLQRHLATNPRRVGLDTEFIRERTYWPQLALVQLAIGDDILLIDPLEPGITDALRPLLLDTSITKVMHSAGEDLVAFHHACGAVPTPLFDTQVAAALAGIGAGMGYQRLVSEMLGVDLPKGETRSDWLKRPLRPAQLEYAADDVVHLAALHERLAERLQDGERRAWFEEDCARLVAAAGNGEERWPHLSFRASQFLDEDSRVRLLRLLRWREQHARDRDRPRSWILDNELAT